MVRKRREWKKKEKEKEKKKNLFKWFTARISKIVIVWIEEMSREEKNMRGNEEIEEEIRKEMEKKVEDRRERWEKIVRSKEGVQEQKDGWMHAWMDGWIGGKLSNSMTTEERNN